MVTRKNLNIKVRVQLGARGFLPVVVVDVVVDAVVVRGAVIGALDVNGNLKTLPILVNRDLSCGIHSNGYGGIFVPIGGSCSNFFLEFQFCSVGSGYFFISLLVTTIRCSKGKSGGTLLR